jgi:hypothetical protein
MGEGGRTNTGFVGVGDNIILGFPTKGLCCDNNYRDLNIK